MANVRALLGLLVMLPIAGCAMSRAISPDSAPSALPAAVAAPAQRTITYPHGEWVLYGNGATESPYAWVWVPTGATPPPAR